MPSSSQNATTFTRQSAGALPGIGTLKGYTAHGTITAIAVTLSLWLMRSRERAELADLDSKALSELGLSPCDIQRVTGKWFWQE